MSKGDTEIEMNFKVGNAAAANNIMREVYRNQQAGLRATAKEADKTGLAFASLSKAFAGAAAVASILQAAGVLKRSALEIKAAHQAMAEAVTPLSSLGNNAHKLPELRVETGRMAAETGRPVEEVGQALFDIQSSTGNYSEAERNELKRGAIDMAQATGGNLSTSANLLVKTKQIYGDEAGDVTEISNKLMYAQDKASLGFEDLATRLPELAGAGKVVNVTLEELLGTLIGASQKSGDIPKMFTASRNILLLMAEASERGIVLTGSYLDKVGQLRAEMERDPEAFGKLFGKENIGSVALMAESAENIRKESEKIAQIDGSANRAKDIIGQRMKDPVYRDYVMDRTIDSLRQNAPSLAGEKALGSLLGDMNRRMELGALAAQFETGEGPGSLSSRWGAVRGLLSDGLILQRGREIMLENMHPGPQRDAILEENFRARQAEELKKIYSRDALSQLGLYYSPADQARLNEIQGSSFDVERERQRYPYQAPDSKTMAENTAALKENTAAMNFAAKARAWWATGTPGGARTNYEE